MPKIEDYQIEIVQPKPMTPRKKIAAVKDAIEKGSVHMGLILVADDQQLCLDALFLNLTEVGLEDHSEFFTDGQQIIDRVQKIIDDAMHDDSSNMLPGRPIQALLLDF